MGFKSFTKNTSGCGGYGYHEAASNTYGLYGLNDWCERQFAAECSIGKIDFFELAALSLVTFFVHQRK
jgi:hypothetical protein